MKSPMKHKAYTEQDISEVSLNDSIKRRPQLYFIENFRNQTLDTLPFEVCCHAFDEHLDGHCHKIIITLNKDGFSIEYNAGISLKNIKPNNLPLAEMIMTEVMACSNLKKHLAVGQEFCTTGMAIVNAASTSCKLETIWNNKKGIFLFENGALISKNIKSNDTNDSWTKLMFKPNPEIFGDFQFTSNGIQEKIKTLNKKLPTLKIIVDDRRA